MIHLYVPPGLARLMSERGVKELEQVLAVNGTSTSLRPALLSY
ncbi:MAG TPA: hypothetical protein VMY88_05590 [Acidimicrobiales bacterium]|nr:hypothetical protein [Acidimicrobiales bacterium]